ncbi:M48 family metallopeptidase [Actinoplanes sp. NPDC049316]|uniref:M48 family metallopeptidase n=1 Tax=Actinoplanes sp. NPDC049316 TaxID=3154727 RepID=UPI0034130595
MYHQIARNKRLTVVYIGLFLLIWLGIGAAVGAVRAATSSGSYAADVGTGALIAALAAVGGVLFTLRSGSRLVLAVAGAQPADPARYPQLYHLVEALAIGEGVPVPAVYVVDDPSPNAFATGFRPDRAAVTVTSGLLAMLNREELEGVLAHELSHIRNLDTRLLLVVTTLIGMAALLASLIWHNAFWLRGRGRNGAQVTLVVAAAAALLSVVAFLVGPLIRLALSRRREFLADASAVELSRNPAGLLGALRKLQRNDTPLRRANHATAAMCIDDPLTHHEGAAHRLFDTHPPLEQRIAVLEGMLQGQTL